MEEISKHFVYSLVENVLGISFVPLDESLNEYISMNLYPKIFQHLFQFSSWIKKSVGMSTKTEIDKVVNNFIYCTKKSQVIYSQVTKVSSGLLAPAIAR